MNTADPPEWPAEALLAETRAELGHADSKASMILASLGIGAGATLAGFIAGDWSPTTLGGAGQVAWWLGAVAALAAAFLAAKAVWPQTTHQQPDGPVMFWAHAAEFETVEALGQHAGRHPVSHHDRSVDQLWHVSRVLRSKYTNIKRSLVAACIGAVLFLIAGLTTL